MLLATLHAMWLHTDVLRLLSQILWWKDRSLTRYGWAIEFRVCAQRCVCAGGLPWSKMRVVCCLQEGAREERQQGQVDVFLYLWPKATPTLSNASK